MEIVLFIFTSFCYVLKLIFGFRFVFSWRIEIFCEHCYYSKQMLSTFVIKYLLTNSSIIDYFSDLQDQLNPSFLFCFPLLCNFIPKYAQLFAFGYKTLHLRHIWKQLLTLYSLYITDDIVNICYNWLLWVMKVHLFYFLFKCNFWFWDCYQLEERNILWALILFKTNATFLCC